MQECQRLAIEVLPILGEPATTIEPGDGAFDDPAFGQDRKSAGPIGSLDDFNIEVWENFCERVGELRPLIAAVGEELLQERKHSEQRRHDENAAVAILDVSRMDDGVEQET